MNDQHFILDFAALVILLSFFLLIEPKNFRLSLSLSRFEELMDDFFLDFLMA